MGLFSKKEESNVTAAEADADSVLSGKTACEQPKKKSLFQKYDEFKRGPGVSNLSDEELKKYIGMNHAELKHYTDTAPGVGGGQRAGDITAGGTSGFGLTATGAGLGGFGFNSQGPGPKERLPPKA